MQSGEDYQKFLDVVKAQLPDATSEGKENLRNFCLENSINPNALAELLDTLKPSLASSDEPSSPNVDKDTKKKSRERLLEGKLRQKLLCIIKGILSQHQRDHTTSKVKKTKLKILTEESCQGLSLGPKDSVKPVEAQSPSRNTKDCPGCNADPSSHFAVDGQRFLEMHTCVGLLDDQMDMVKPGQNGVENSEKFSKDQQPQKQRKGKSDYAVTATSLTIGDEVGDYVTVTAHKTELDYSEPGFSGGNEKILYIDDDDGTLESGEMASVGEQVLSAQSPSKEFIIKDSSCSIASMDFSEPQPKLNIPSLGNFEDQLVDKDLALLADMDASTAMKIGYTYGTDHTLNFSHGKDDQSLPTPGISRPTSSRETSKRRWRHSWSFLSRHQTGKTRLKTDTKLKQRSDDSKKMGKSSQDVSVKPVPKAQIEKMDEVSLVSIQNEPIYQGVTADGNHASQSSTQETKHELGKVVKADEPGTGGKMDMKIELDDGSGPAVQNEPIHQGISADGYHASQNCRHTLANERGADGKMADVNTIKKGVTNVQRKEGQDTTSTSENGFGRVIQSPRSDNMPESKLENMKTEAVEQDSLLVKEKQDSKVTKDAMMLDLDKDVSLEDQDSGQKNLELTSEEKEQDGPQIFDDSNDNEVAKVKEIPSKNMNIKPCISNGEVEMSQPRSGRFTTALTSAGSSKSMEHAEILKDDLQLADARKHIADAKVKDKPSFNIDKPLTRNGKVDMSQRKSGHSSAALTSSPGNKVQAVILKKDMRLDKPHVSIGEVDTSQPRSVRPNTDLTSSGERRKEDKDVENVEAKVLRRSGGSDGNAGNTEGRLCPTEPNENQQHNDDMLARSAHVGLDIAEENVVEPVHRVEKAKDARGKLRPPDMVNNTAMAHDVKNKMPVISDDNPLDGAKEGCDKTQQVSQGNTDSTTAGSTGAQVNMRVSVSSDFKRNPPDTRTDVGNSGKSHLPAESGTAAKATSLVDHQQKPLVMVHMHDKAVGQKKKSSGLMGNISEIMDKNGEARIKNHSNRPSGLNLSVGNAVVNDSSQKCSSVPPESFVHRRSQSLVAEISGTNAAENSTWLHKRIGSLAQLKDKPGVDPRFIPGSPLSPIRPLSVINFDSPKLSRKKQRVQSENDMSRVPAIRKLRMRSTLEFRSKLSEENSYPEHDASGDLKHAATSSNSKQDQNCLADKTISGNSAKEIKANGRFGKSILPDKKLPIPKKSEHESKRHVMSPRRSKSDSYPLEEISYRQRNVSVSNMDYSQGNGSVPRPKTLGALPPRRKPGGQSKSEPSSIADSGMGLSIFIPPNLENQLLSPGKRSCPDEREFEELGKSKKNDQMGNLSRLQRSKSWNARSKAKLTKKPAKGQTGMARVRSAGNLRRLELEQKPNFPGIMEKNAQSQHGRTEGTKFATPEDQDQVVPDLSYSNKQLGTQMKNTDPPQQMAENWHVDSIPSVSAMKDRRKGLGTRSLPAISQNSGKYETSCGMLINNAFHVVPIEPAQLDHENDQREEHGPSTSTATSLNLGEYQTSGGNAFHVVPSLSKPSTPTNYGGFDVQDVEFGGDSQGFQDRDKTNSKQNKMDFQTTAVPHPTVATASFAMTDTPPTTPLDDGGKDKGIVNNFETLALDPGADVLGACGLQQPSIQRVDKQNGFSVSLEQQLAQNPEYSLLENLAKHAFDMDNDQQTTYDGNKMTDVQDLLSGLSFADVPLPFSQDENQSQMSGDEVTSNTAEMETIPMVTYDTPVIPEVNKMLREDLEFPRPETISVESTNIEDPKEELDDEAMLEDATTNQTLETHAPRPHDDGTAAAMDRVAQENVNRMNTEETTPIRSFEECTEPHGINPFIWYSETQTSNQGAARPQIREVKLRSNAPKRQCLQCKSKKRIGYEMPCIRFLCCDCDWRKKQQVAQDTRKAVTDETDRAYFGFQRVCRICNLHVINGSGICQLCSYFFCSEECFHKHFTSSADLPKGCVKRKF